ncbi:sugar phosphate nucleotidyltransferase [Gemmatimonas sp.]|jgi:mannose-1-phosphate guanylyltransferase|uniref:mannose-1-phosphate guanylyltransferase n=2 Tax=Gemmatimonas sp. TaxID=1962908 RepID=UPI0022C68F96|nr:sugar phosphate nucleotidyltransferase [Gemmatimonas sp.]MCZ8206010.1 sugar phosphate nucleotidyltransferase [Gemmatimonas sp.]
MSETRVVSPTAPTSVTNTDALAAGTLEEVDLEAMLGTGTAMWAVVFAGGIGTRFWPLSTPRRPKQVLALVNERPLIADTVARLAPLVPAERVLVVTSADIADALHEAIPEVPRSNLLIEPRPLGTAAALAWGAQEVSRRAGPDTVFVALHADLAVGYPEVLRDSLRRAAAIAAADSALVALGARPTRAETGFGYLQPGMPLDPLQSRAEGGACRVEHFVEKPGAALADVLIERGALWNTGIFVWRARVVLDELDRHTAEVRHGLPLLAAGAMEQFAELVSSVSIDRGLLERSPNVVVLPADMEWDDVGTWASLRRVRELDDTGNGVMGQVHCVDCSGNVIHADGCCVVAYGISGMIVVSIDGLTFVTTQDRATELGPLLNALPGSLRFNPGGH